MNSHKIILTANPHRRQKELKKKSKLKEQFHLHITKHFNYNQSK